MSTSGSNYVPNNNLEFCAWLKIVIAYARANCKRWGVMAPDENFEVALERLETLSQLCTTSKYTPENMVERNTLRKEVEGEARSYLQGMVMRNKHVTDVDRIAMGLKIRDKIRTPTGDPVGQAEAMISYPARTQLLLRIHHIAGTPEDARANYGCRIYYGVFPLGHAQLSELNLYESRFTRNKKVLFSFNPEDSGKMAVFCIRYENSKGKAGPWGPMFSAVIP